MSHGIVDIFAFQESLLIEAVFTIAILAMIWAGFRRWLQHQDKMGRLIAEQLAERDAQYGAQMKCVEERLKAIERIVTDGTVEPGGELDAPGFNASPDASPKLEKSTPIPDRRLEVKG